MAEEQCAGIKQIRVENPPARHRLSTLLNRIIYFFFFAAFFFFLAATVAHLRSRVVGPEDDDGSPRSEPVIFCFIMKHQLPSARKLFRTHSVCLSLKPAVVRSQSALTALFWIVERDKARTDFRN
jgi:hypothetical protein